MTRMLQAEVLKLTRVRMLLIIAAVLLLASVTVTAIVFTGADSAGDGGFSRFPDVGALEEAGGGTEAFAFGVSFMGFFTFVVLTAKWTTEFSQGTFRTLLLQDSRRTALLAGMLGGLLVSIAAALAVAGVATWLASFAIAPTVSVSRDAWFSPGAINAHLQAYSLAFIVLSAWTCFGMALGILVRSTPLALAIGIAWAGPVEHILQNNWSALGAWFPGLLLEALAAGGTPEASIGRALLLTAVYVCLAACLAIVSLRRRDLIA